MNINRLAKPIIITCSVGYEKNNNKNPLNFLGRISLEFTCAISTKGKYEIANTNGGMIYSARSTIQMNRPTHILKLEKLITICFAILKIDKKRKNKENGVKVVSRTSHQFF